MTLDLRNDPDVVAADRERGHAFQAPADVLATVPGLYATESTPIDEKSVRLHYFAGGWDWYVVEIDPVEALAFGFVTSPLCPTGEWGYVDLAELAVLRVPVATVLDTRTGETTVRVSLPVERDLHWTSTTFAEVRP